MARNQIRSEELLFRWRNAFLSETGPASSTTRYVLLVLSTFMAMDGRGCFPGMDLIAKKAGLSKKSVIDHMARAKSEGWISRKERRRPGRAWWSYEYAPRFPANDLDVVTDVHHVNGSDAVNLAPDVVTLVPDVVNDVLSNSSENSSGNSDVYRKESGASDPREAHAADRAPKPPAGRPKAAAPSSWPDARSAPGIGRWRKRPNCGTHPPTLKGSNHE